MKLEGSSYIIVIHLEWHVHWALQRNHPIAFVKIEHCIVLAQSSGLEEIAT